MEQLRERPSSHFDAARLLMVGWEMTVVRKGVELPDEQPITSRLSGAGSLRRELEAVLVAAAWDTSLGDYRRLILEKNRASKGSASMRNWAWKRLKVRYLLDPDLPEFRAFFSAMAGAHEPDDRGLIAFLMMARTDRLFREVTAATVVPHLGRSGHIVDSAEVRADVDVRGRLNALNWSESSARNLANHILSSLKDFGILAGSAKKRIRSVRPGPQVTLFATRLGRLEGLSDRKVLDSRWFRLLGLDTSAVVDAMYAAARSGLLRFRFQADVAEIELPSLEAAS